MKKKYLSGILACLMVFSLSSAVLAEEAPLTEENLTEEAAEESVDAAEEAGEEAAEEVIVEEEQEDEILAAEESADQAAGSFDLDALADGLIEEMDEKAVNNASWADWEACDDYRVVVVSNTSLTGDSFDSGPETYTWYDLGTEMRIEGNYGYGAICEPAIISGAAGITYNLSSLPTITHFYECQTENEDDRKSVIFQVVNPSCPKTVSLPLNASVNTTINPFVVWSESPQFTLYNLIPSVSGVYTFTSADPYANNNDSDPIAYLYDSSNQLICCQDDGSTGYNFQFFRYLEAGKRYSVAIGYYDFDGRFEDDNTDYAGTYPVSVKYGAPAGHEHDKADMTGEKAPTCGAPGYTTYRCSICGQTYNVPEGKATGQHKWGAWVEVTPADTDRANVAQRTCSVCHAVQKGSTAGAIPITIPKAPSSLKAKAEAKGKVTVSWKKFKVTKKTKAIWKKIKKIEVQYSEDPNFNTGKKVKLIKKSAKKLTLKLSKNKIYYIRTRYTDGSRGYSKWVTKKVKTKKK